MKKLAIIGANSILAQSIFDKLEFDNQIVQVYNNRKDKIRNQEKLIHISEFLALKSNFDVIFFLSSIIDYSENSSSILKIFETNVELLAIISEKFPNSKIIHSSSVSIYKNQEKTIFENSEIEPKNSYSISKLWAEKIVTNHKGIGINIRLSSLFGKQMNTNTFLPKIIQNAIESKEIIIFGDGSRKQNYINADEAAIYFCNAMHMNATETILAVNSNSYSNLDVAQIIQQSLDNVIIKHSGNDNSPSFIYNNQKTKQELNIKQEYSFSDSLSELIQWMQKQS
jgi:nucleoside-diphosphate-sugar epimerase